jgi:hypothetical protein
MYRVVWLQGALNHVTTAWLNADPALRRAITAAVHRVDQQLRTDPFGTSESRPEGRRITFVAPLGITFRVQPGSRSVSIVRVWVVKKRPA